MTEAHGQSETKQCLLSNPSHFPVKYGLFIQWNANQPRCLMLKEQAQLIECGLIQNRPS